MSRSLVLSRVRVSEGESELNERELGGREKVREG